MPISFVCSSCNTTLRVADEFAGRKVKCPKCSGVAEVPKAPPPKAAAEADRGSGQPGPKRAAVVADALDEDKPRPRRRGIDDIEDEDDDLDEEDRPKRKRKLSGERKSGKDLWEIAIFQKVIMLCLLGYAIAVVGQFTTPPDLRLFVALGGLVVLVTAAVVVFLLALKVYSVGVGIAMAIWTLVPLAGLIALLKMNAQATSILKENGIHVGLWGARMSDID